MLSVKSSIYFNSLRKQYWQKYLWKILLEKKQKPNVASVMEQAFPLWAPSGHRGPPRVDTHASGARLPYLKRKFEKLTGNLHQKVKVHVTSVTVVHKKHLENEGGAHVSRALCPSPSLAQRCHQLLCVLSVNPTSLWERTVPPEHFSNLYT